MSGWFNYERIGLYYRTRRHGRVNFCDLHFWGSMGDLGNKGVKAGDSDPHGHNGTYSGPKSPIVPYAKRGPTIDAYDRYDLCRTAGDPDWDEGYGVICGQHSVTGGGNAHIVYTERKTYECWMLGPIGLEGSGGYGSLIADLEGFAEHPWIHPFVKFPPGGLKEPPKTGPWDHPEQGRVGVFRPCALWGSHETGRGVKPWDYRSYFADPARNMFPAAIPKGVISIEWKVEDWGAKLTEDEVMQKAG